MNQILHKTFSEVQLCRILKFAQRINQMGANLYCYDLTPQCILSAMSHPDQTMPETLDRYVHSTIEQGSGAVHDFGPDGEAGHVQSMLFRDGDHQVAVLLVETPAHIEAVPGSGDQREGETQASLGSEMVHQSIYQMLLWFAEDFKSSTRTSEQLDIVSSELAQTYEELSLLYNMSTNMKVTQTNASYLQMACDQITQIVPVEGIAILIKSETDPNHRYRITAGAGYVSLDPMLADILESRLLQEISQGKEALLDSQIDSPFKYEWPENIKNIIAVPMGSGKSIFGILFATNRMEKMDFDSIDLKLFTSVANQCAVFIENDHLFGDLKELFIGALKALTNSIDAKDKYTRGHSDRVAFISRWIAERYAEQFPLPDDCIHKIYLSGLLHDIGKIGINEILLQKKGRLSEDEKHQLQAHPRIGAAILNNIKQMQEIVPGVLYHHERYDGTGYPEGLAGDDIPLIGKIIGLADAFDAMTSRRVYREAMSTRRALDEIRKGLGRQFDPEVGTIFLNSDLTKLWSIIHDGFIESWDYSNFSEYGSKAVGTLIRPG